MPLLPRHLFIAFALSQGRDTNLLMYGAAALMLSFLRVRDVLREAPALQQSICLEQTMERRRHDAIGVGTYMHKAAICNVALMIAAWLCPLAQR